MLTRLMHGSKKCVDSYLQHFMFYRVLAGCMPLLWLLSACGRDKKPDPAAAFGPEDHYYSLHQFAQDQYLNIFQGQPIVLVRLATLNGETDSSLVGIDTLDWAPVLKTFFDADISPRKFLGRYRYSVISEPMLSTKTLSYEALEPELFTRSLQINADEATGRVKSIFIQTSKKGLQQKLYYAPKKIIQIQETEKPMFGKARNLRVEYRFMGLEEAEPVFVE